MMQISAMFFTMALIINSISIFAVAIIGTNLEKRVIKLEQKQATPFDRMSLDELIDQRRKERCGELKRLPCLFETGYWR